MCGAHTIEHFEQLERLAAVAGAVRDEQIEVLELNPYFANEARIHASMLTALWTLNGNEEKSRRIDLRTSFSVWVIGFVSCRI